MKLKPLGKNKNELQIRDSTVFFSYQTPVAAITPQGCFKTSKKWSTTTSRHISDWLDGRTATEKPQEFFDKLIEN